MSTMENEANPDGLPFEIQNFLLLSPVTKCFFSNPKKRKGVFLHGPINSQGVYKKEVGRIGVLHETMTVAI